RGRLPPREQEPHRGGGGPGAPRLRHREDRGPRPLTGASGAARRLPRARGRRSSVMNMTPEQQELGRRNFMKALAGTPALAALGAAAALKGPVGGGPVRLGFIGRGGEGRVLLEQTDAAFGEVRAICDITPAHLAKADDVLAKGGKPAAKHYADWKEMLQKEDLE